MKGFYSTVFLSNMVINMAIELSEETMKKLHALKNIIDSFADKKMKGISQYAEIILDIGINSILNNLFRENELLQDTMKAMFERNPDFVGKFIADMIKIGKLKPEEKWRADIT